MIRFVCMRPVSAQRGRRAGFTSIWAHAVRRCGAMWKFNATVPRYSVSMFPPSTSQHVYSTRSTLIPMGYDCVLKRRRRDFKSVHNIWCMVMYGAVQTEIVWPRIRKLHISRVSLAVFIYRSKRLRTQCNLLHKKLYTENRTKVKYLFSDCVYIVD